MDTKDRKVGEYISEIFRPDSYSVRNSLVSLDKLGGILGINFDK